MIKNDEKIFHYVTKQLPFKTNFPKVDQHTGGHDTKHRKGNQLQSLDVICKIS